MGPTAPRTGETERDLGATGRSDRAPAALPAIAIVVVVGLALRFIIAYVLFPGSGFKTDLGSFTSWALTLAHGGPGGFYASAGFADYPPGYLYVLWLLGAVGDLLAQLTGGDPASTVGNLLKIPPILADAAVGYLIYRVARRWLGARPGAEGLAVSAAALYLLNPVTWYDSALWGQVDAIGALVMLGAILWLIDGQSELATVATVVASLVKPQYGVVLVPVVGVVLLRRHLFRPGSGPRPGVGPSLLGDWVTSEQGPWRLVSSAALGLLVLFALMAPFALDLPSLVQHLANTAGGYPWLTVNAYNPWALLNLGGQPSLASAGIWTSDMLPLLGPIPAVVVGTVLLGLGFLVGVVQLALRDDRRSILLTTVVLAAAFFVLPTRVHERYLFPVFAFLPLLSLADRRLRWATLLLAVASFVNLHGVLTIPLYATPNIADLALGDTFRSFPFVAFSALAQTAVFVYLVWRLRPVSDLVVAPLRRWAGLGPRRPDAADVVPPSLPEEPVQPRDREESQGREALGLARAGGQVAEPGGGSSLEGGGLVAAAAAQPRARGALRAWFEGQLARRPLRRDRSHELTAEPPGRLDRVDLVVLVVLVVLAMALRGWRVQEPYGMYFDEVYHARTATEFLQDWRYGQPHDIYEFTHPHLAKYLIAVGIEAFGDDQVTGQANLGTTVSDALVEARWSPADAPALRDGDRLYVATGRDVGVYDLQTRALVARLTVATGSASRLALDADAHLLYIADASGGLWRFDTTVLDQARQGGGVVAASLATVRVGTFGGAVTHLLVADSGQRVVALQPGGHLVALQAQTGSITGQVSDTGASAMITVDLGTAERVAVADAQGVTYYDPAALTRAAGTRLAEAATGLALVTGLDQPTLYVAAGTQLERVELTATGDPPEVGKQTMPGSVTDVAWDRASNLVHVLGMAPDGKTSTIYVVEPHGNAVFADARLPFSPAAWAFDQQHDYPSQDRQQILAFAADGQLAVVDAGHNAFGWRFIGVILGALMAGLLYLMGRFLFRRRGVALVMSGLVMADGMFFANARIAMNDIYVAFFMVAALTLFLPLYLGIWRGRLAALLTLPGVGILLGLAFASKWVAPYAMGGLALLILLRSALGRWLALGAMIVMTALLGWLAIVEPATDTLDLVPGAGNAPLGNLVFVAGMVFLTVLLAAAMVMRPIRWSLAEVRFAVGAPVVLGPLLALGLTAAREPLAVTGIVISAQAPLLAGSAFVALGVAAFVAFQLAGRVGLGPLAPPPAPDDPARGLEPPDPAPTAAWLRPGAFLGLPWFGALACLLILPLVVYVLSYIPWIDLGNQWWPGFPAGHTGQTFLDLQAAMYAYHNDLRATHAALSPWWAWPLDLKPVWWYQDGLANDTVGIIYDAGNLVAFWLALPALAWAAWQGWRRRSLSLAFVVILFMAMWWPWARIDRATFQYHYFTAIPFSFMALAYFIAEIWHGPSPRTWALARFSAAAAIVGVPVLWLLRTPLCWLGGVSIVDPGSQACGYVSEPFILTQRVGVAILVLVVGTVAFLWQMRLAAEERGSGSAGGLLGSVGGRFWPTLTIGATVVAMVVAVQHFSDQPLISAAVGSGGTYLFALLVGIPLAGAAWVVVQMRDPRRWVIGVMAAVALWFVVFYPDVSGLPIPSGLKNLFQVLPLPTYNYDFQFATNVAAEPVGGVRVITPGSLTLMLGVTLLTVAVMYAAWNWRLARVLRRESAGEGLDTATP